VRQISNLGFAIWNVKEYRIKRIEIKRLQLGLWIMRYGVCKEEIKKLETRGWRFETGD